MKRRTANFEYPALKGKVVRQVRFANDEEFTVLVIEFEDNTHVSFRLKATIELSMEPEISTLKEWEHRELEKVESAARQETRKGR